MCAAITLYYPTHHYIPLCSHHMVLPYTPLHTIVQPSHGTTLHTTTYHCAAITWYYPTHHYIPLCSHHMVLPYTPLHTIVKPSHGTVLHTTTYHCVADRCHCSSTSHVTHIELRDTATCLHIPHSDGLKKSNNFLELITVF